MQLRDVREIVTICLILLLFVLQGLQIVKNRKLQAQIDELKIIVNEKFLSSMIFDKYNLTVR